ncbi:dihydrodipicolinate synthase family protein [Bordetella holmesii]|uniref:Dihydrodipicolinate synthetase family protein n=2 Tax=Bordetella holmesii TaxID=35814 RepID=A0A158LZW4_9BORD|nr:dihydrodipicolinate synthase family protein [Bordetella holmesii]AHV91374.1 putative dihydrodipicoline synthase related protein [Bordetella holmesii ATCC 51541]AIT25752.1 putative dihydrodipicoline synthase related protein [Bordetella holmesii 44057]EWM43077.1 putative dihydrodipicoline synthase related protein [Bordetella holmesii 41130]EWM46318.1 putative dihydrodipicoline synthase related protein [Bordetella holmesii 35009]EWM50478.1 putative dihydrodipicoline synthase related protein [B
MSKIFSGLFVVAQTPFTDDGSLDLPSVDTLCDFYLEHGAAGLTVLGVAGEAAKLSMEESIATVRRYVARANGKPVIAGVSNPSVAQLATLTKEVMEAGAYGVMIAPASGLKTEEEILNYFAAVFARIGDVPTVLQDFPFSTGVWMSVPTIARLIERFPQIQAIKEEDIPSAAKITRIRAALVRPVPILTGNNGVFLLQELAHGIEGPMAGFSYPEMLSGVHDLYSAGKVEEAHDLFDTYLPLLSFENQSQWGVAVRKEVLKRRGAISSAAMRAPGPALTQADLKDIDVLVRRVEKAIAKRA